jgi:hypothetical protein
VGPSAHRLADAPPNSSGRPAFKLSRRPGVLPGRGIPPGKCRICVEHERKRRDLFEGADNTDTTPYVFDVDSRTRELVIDLDRWP